MSENLTSTSANSANTTSEHARLLQLATYASVSVALILIVAKFAAWVMTESVSLLSTLIDSLLDAGASLVNLIAVRHALQPPDAHHRFGHGKAEPLAGLGQAAFITGSAVFLLLQAGERLVRVLPERPGVRALDAPHDGRAGVVGHEVLDLGLSLRGALGPGRLE